MRIRVGIASAIIAAACGGSSSPTGASNNPPPPGPSVQSVTMTDYAFSPATLTIKAGTAVKWANSGTVSHTATSDGGAFDSQALTPPTSSMDPYGGTTTTPGASFQTTFTTPGTYPYHCTYHGTANNMKGTITVNP